MSNQLIIVKIPQGDLLKKHFRSALQLLTGEVTDGWKRYKLRKVLDPIAAATKKADQAVKALTEKWGQKSAFEALYEEWALKESVIAQMKKEDPENYLEKIAECEKLKCMVLKAKEQDFIIAREQLLEQIYDCTNFGSAILKKDKDAYEAEKKALLEEEVSIEIPWKLSFSLTKGFKMAASQESAIAAFLDEPTEEELKDVPVIPAAEAGRKIQRGKPGLVLPPSVHQ